MHRTKRLKPSQWNVLKRVRLEALRDTPDAFGTTYEEESQYNEEEWRKRLQREDCITYVAFIEDSPIGLVVGAPYDERAGLFAMWVNSKYRGKGLGSRLVDRIIEWARSNEYSAILLDVADNNTSALALYVRKGFTPTGITGRLPAPRDYVKEHQRVLYL